MHSYFYIFLFHYYYLHIYFPCLISGNPVVPERPAAVAKGERVVVQTTAVRKMTVRRTAPVEKTTARTSFEPGGPAGAPSPWSCTGRGGARCDTFSTRASTRRSTGAGCRCGSV